MRYGKGQCGSVAHSEEGAEGVREPSTMRIWFEWFLEILVWL